MRVERHAPPACMKLPPSSKEAGLAAGRAAEEVVYGRDEMSTINQRALAMARRIVQKLVVAGGLSASPALPPAPISVPVPMDDAMGQVVPSHVRPAARSRRDSAIRETLRV